MAAAAAGAKIICLPECFNSPYDTSCFPKYSEPIPETASALDPTTSPSTAMLLEVARLFLQLDANEQHVLEVHD